MSIPDSSKRKPVICDERPRKVPVGPTGRNVIAKAFTPGVSSPQTLRRAVGAPRFSLNVHGNYKNFPLAFFPLLNNRQNSMTPKEKRAKTLAKPQNANPRFARMQASSRFLKFITKDGGPHWFPQDSIEMLAQVNHALRNFKEEGRELVKELKEAGYRPPPLREDFELTDHIFLAGYYHEVLAALWPSELSEALWQAKPPLAKVHVEALIRYLEVNPYFFRSGYCKPTAIKQLKRSELTTAQRRRLVDVLKRIVMSGLKESLTGWYKLAFFGSRPEIQAITHLAIASADPKVQAAGRRLANYAEELIKSSVWPPEEFKPGTES